MVKIDASVLPKLPNINWAGPCPYVNLPERLANWDVGIMPFALNEATRYISPTKTPEFLAAGLPVVSTPIVDVVRGYGEAGLVRIASTAEEFVEEIEALSNGSRLDWLRNVDARLATDSWDATWHGMLNNIGRVQAALGKRKRSRDDAHPKVSKRRPSNSDRYAFAMRPRLFNWHRGTGTELELAAQRSALSLPGFRTCTPARRSASPAGDVWGIGTYGSVTQFLQRMR